jgi:hypothetical protein
MKEKKQISSASRILWNSYQEAPSYALTVLSKKKLCINGGLMLLSLKNTISWLVASRARYYGLWTEDHHQRTTGWAGDKSRCLLDVD